MRPVFKDYSQGQITLFPASLDDKIKKDSPVRLVNEIVERLDALRDQISFMWLSAGREPDHNTINRFRSKNLKNTINEVFTQVVRKKTSGNGKKRPGLPNILIFIVCFIPQSRKHPRPELFLP
jgi:transposase